MQSQNIVYMRTRIYIRCVMYDIKRPEVAGILVVIYGKESS